MCVCYFLFNSLNLSVSIGDTILSINNISEGTSSQRLSAFFTGTPGTPVNRQALHL